MTLALAAAIGVLVGWFGRPLWMGLIERIEMRRARRRVRDSPVAKARYPMVEATGDEKWVSYPGPWNNPKPPDGDA